MARVIILDSYPLSLLAARRGKPEVDACRNWMEDCIAQGAQIYLPEITDYEVRRELIRASKTTSVSRLDGLQAFLKYLPLSTSTMRSAALLWAQVRNAGLTTANDKALDGDVILAAQALSLGVPAADIVVATSNPGHLARFVAADEWRNIVP